MFSLHSIRMARRLLSNFLYAGLDKLWRGISNLLAAACSLALEAHRLQIADILRRVAGALYSVSQLVRCLRLFPEPHHSHDANLLARVAEFRPSAGSIAAPIAHGWSDLR
jgi:hypothetical protein